MSDEADVTHHAMDWYNQGICKDIIEYFAVRQVDLIGYLIGCRTASIGYFGSRCNASGCKVE
jgi:hypothetical protein